MFYVHEVIEFGELYKFEAAVLSYTQRKKCLGGGFYRRCHHVDRLEA